jgi:hypothetical protein
MPDLSKMLGDVYDAPAEAPEAPEADSRPTPATRRPVPEWSDDEHLDRAFAGWTPGPSADAPAKERNLFAGGDDAPAPLADDLATALSEAVLAEKAGADVDRGEPAVQEPSPPMQELHEAPEVHEVPAMRATAFGTLTSDTLVARPVSDEPPADVVEVAEPAPVEPEKDPVVEDARIQRQSPEGWQRSDDDILPAGGGKASAFSFSLRRR